MSQNALPIAVMIGGRTGAKNTAIGHNALANNTTAFYNTATRAEALELNTTGHRNTADGTRALFNNSTGDGNIALGTNAGSGVTTANDVVCIGAAGANVGGSCYIGNIFNQSSPSGIAVFINSGGKLGRATSSAETSSRWAKTAKCSWR